MLLPPAPPLLPCGCRSLPPGWLGYGSLLVLLTSRVGVRARNHREKKGLGTLIAEGTTEARKGRAQSQQNEIFQVSDRNHSLSFCRVCPEPVLADHRAFPFENELQKRPGSEKRSPFRFETPPF